MHPDAPTVILGVALICAAYLAPGVLTGVGQWRRTRRLGSVLVAGVFWPFAWVVWYLRER